MADARRLCASIFSSTPARCRRIHVVEEHLRVARDPGQRRVDLVGDSAARSRERRGAPGEHLLLELLALGDVVERDDAAPSPPAPGSPRDREVHHDPLPLPVDERCTGRSDSSSGDDASRSRSILRTIAGKPPRSAGPGRPRAASRRSPRAPGSTRGSAGLVHQEEAHGAALEDPLLRAWSRSTCSACCDSRSRRAASIAAEAWADRVERSARSRWRAAPRELDARRRRGAPAGCS